jgi:hypothetical protein
MKRMTAPAQCLLPWTDFLEPSSRRRCGIAIRSPEASVAQCPARESGYYSARRDISFSTRAGERASRWRD